MLYYERRGKGEPLVLIHGFLGTHRIFEKVMDQFAVSYDVIAIDLPGHGNSPMNEDVLTIYDYVKEIIGLLQSLKIEKATWIGHSLGGYITYAALQSYRKYLSRAAAVYSAPTSDDPISKENREVNVRAIKEKGIDLFAQERIPSYFSEDSDHNDIIFAIETAMQTSELGAIRALYAMRDRPNQIELLDKIDIPLLILSGNKDQWDGEFTRSSPSSYVTFKETDTSHMGMLDEPELFLHKVKSWLEETKYRCKKQHSIT